MYITGYGAHFFTCLALVRQITPQGETVGMLGSTTGAQHGWAPGPLATKYLTNPKPDRLISCHMAGWLANRSWQAGWLTITQNVNLTFPQGETCCDRVCDYFGHKPVVRFPPQ